MNFFIFVFMPHNISPLNRSDDVNNILSALRKGDATVFRHLYAAYYKKLCVFLSGYTNDTVIVEDIVQDVFLKIWSDRKKLTIQKSISGYLYKIAYNSLMQSHRQLKRNNGVLESFYYTALVQAADTDEEDKNTLLQKLDRCIEELPERCKEVFCGNKIKGQPYAQVAMHLNISVKTVEGHISRAYAYLRACMADR